MEEADVLSDRIGKAGFSSFSGFQSSLQESCILDDSLALAIPYG